MTARKPIAFEDIRIGDKVEQRFVRRGCATRRRGVVTAIKDGEVTGERWSVRIGDSDLTSSEDVEWFLLDRPVPPVDLPTEPTLGWLTLPGGRALETVWTSNDKASLHRALGGSVDVANVTAFTPATAVPTAALDELRKHTPGWSTASVTTFLAAVDEANGKSA